MDKKIYIDLVIEREKEKERERERRKEKDSDEKRQRINRAMFGFIVEFFHTQAFLPS